MRRSRRALVVLAAVVAGVAVLAAIGFFVARPALTGPISTVTFNQSKAVPDYDGAEYTITEESRLAELAALFDEHNAVPELVSISNLGTCAGGTSTTAEITFSSGRVARMQLTKCGEGDGPFGDFVDEATGLFSSWKDGR